MYWYNPTTRTSERVQAPSTDQQAIRMLAGTQDSAAFVNEYCELRRSGTPMEQALVLVGHEFRLKQQEYQLALRQEIWSEICFHTAERKGYKLASENPLKVQVTHKRRQRHSDSHASGEGMVGGRSYRQEVADLLHGPFVAEPGLCTILRSCRRSTLRALRFPWAQGRTRD